MRVRQLVLPAALAVTTIVVSAACGDSESEEGATSDCSDTSACEVCLDTDGNKACGDPNCFYDEGSDTCEEAVA